MTSFPRLVKSTLSRFVWKTVKVSLGPDLADLVFLQGLSFFGSVNVLLPPAPWRT
jgi:hypothetical protein